MQALVYYWFRSWIFTSDGRGVTSYEAEEALAWQYSCIHTYVLTNSDLFAKGEDGTLLPDSRRMINGYSIPLLIMGDHAYPLLPWLLKVTVTVEAAPLQLPSKLI